MMAGGTPRLLQGACSSYSMQRALQARLAGSQGLRVRVACPLPGPLSPSAMEVSLVSLERAWQPHRATHIS